MLKNNLINKLETKYINSIELLLIIVLSILLLPFLVLSFYNAPAVDDYSYALKTMDFGFWGGQMEAYKQWNGRYFASFILCLNIISGNSFAIYKLLPVVLIIANTHAIFRLLDIVFHKQQRLFLLMFSCCFAFIFLNFLPSITQGIYWAPGAITYNLGNIMFVYLMGLIIQFKTTDRSNIKKSAIIFITILACGLNESTMVAVDLMIVIFIVYFLIVNNRLDTFLFMLLFIAIVCTIIMAVSPGNHIRDTGFLDPHKKNITFTIVSSFKTLFNYLSIWLLNWRMFLISAGSIIFFANRKNEINTVFQRGLRFVLIFILGFSLVAAALAPGFWSTGYIAPDRTINAVYWLFLVWWFASLFSFANLIKAGIERIQISSIFPLILVIFICISFYGETKNYNRAVLDVLTGRAFIYGKEWKSRLNIISKSTNVAIAELPEFSVIPGTIFHEDIKDDEEEWFNKEFARFYNLSKVRLGKKVAQMTKKVNINFENDPTVKFKSPISISTEFAHSAPNSNLLNGENTYSATYEIMIKDIDPTGLAFKTVIIEANVLSTFNVVDYVLVVSINDSNDKNILWQGKDFINNNYKQNNWNREKFSYTIKESSALNPENKISVYIWNRSKNAVYVDDIDITFE